MYNDHIVQLPYQFRADKKSRHIFKRLSIYFLKTDRLGASTTSPGSQEAHLTMLSEGIFS